MRKIYGMYRKLPKQLRDSFGMAITAVGVIWGLLPMFRDNMWKVPTIHVLYKTNPIKAAFEDEKFMVNSKIDTEDYYFTI